MVLIGFSPCQLSMAPQAYAKVYALGKPLWRGEGAVPRTGLPRREVFVPAQVGCLLGCRYVFTTNVAADYQVEEGFHFGVEGVHGDLR